MMQNNIMIAVTGGIGSGKSTVCKIINKIGYPVISCDEIYSTILNDTYFLKKLSSEFGNNIIKDGKLDKTKLSSIVFSDKIKLNKLNEITHPEIMKNLFVQTKKYRICFCEVPLLFEGGYEKDFNEVIVVLRDRNERIAGVAQRDNLNADAIEKRINSQIQYDNLKFTQYYVIHNNDNFDVLYDRTLKILQDLKIKYDLF